MSHALVTGASSGIGKELAILFAKAGIPLIVTSSERSHGVLHSLAEELANQYRVDVRAVCFDLAVSEGPSQLVRWIDDQGVEIEYLVNNAGFGIVGKKMYEYDPTKFHDMVQVNVVALSELVMHFLPRMVARDRGRILNVSSIAGYVIPHGLEAGYSATKAYVVSLSEGISDDLRGTSVTCTHLAPGPVRTRFFERAGLQDDRRVRALYLPADVVAKTGFDAMMKGKTLAMPGISMRLMRFALPFSPRLITARLSGRFVEEPS